MLGEPELGAAGGQGSIVQWEEVPLPALARRVRLKTLQRLQKQFASLAKVTICLTTVDGELITEPTWGCRFTEMIATSPAGREIFANDLVVFAADIKSFVPFIGQQGTRLYAAPIERAGERLGLIVVGTRPDHTLTDQEVGTLAARLGLDLEALKRAAGELEPWDQETHTTTCQFADLLADTIALLYAQAVRIERQVADLRTVHELANLLAGTSDLQEILDRTVQRVVEVMGVKACGIRLLDEEKGELVVKAVCNLSDDYLQKGKVLIGDSMIDTAALKGETVYIPDAPNDSRLRYPEYARKEGIVSCLCVPMIYRGQTVGLLRVYTDRRYVFDAAEESLLRSIASQAASAIINARLREARKETRHFEQQLRHAREIQRRMLPASSPNHARLSFGCAYRPSLQLAGDFYDFLYLSVDAVGLCVADVVGKGLPAALLMASIRSSLRAHAHSIFDLDEILFQVNRSMYRDTLVGEFATLFYGVFWNSGTRLTYCNAGHPPPLLLRGGAFQELDVGGPVIGVMPAECFEKKVLSLREGDVIVFFTDGVTEALDFQGEAYGSGRLRESIQRHRELETQHMADQLLWDVRRFVGLAEQSDDITIVVVKVTRPAGARP
jgi:sigma-B regulation protein RsbU (phosphoserine phosphatase)